jgi:uncharacterized Zn finger protein (UPF0148 family)
MNDRIKQPVSCSKCGSALISGECGKGFCPVCKTYMMRLEVNFSCISTLK